MLAIVAIVSQAAKRNVPDHGYYDDGFVRVHSRCRTIIDAEDEAKRLSMAEPLDEGLTYEPMHWRT